MLLVVLGNSPGLATLATTGLCGLHNDPQKVTIIHLMVFGNKLNVDPRTRSCLQRLLVAILRPAEAWRGSHWARRDLNNGASAMAPIWSQTSARAEGQIRILDEKTDDRCMLSYPLKLTFCLESNSGTALVVSFVLYTKLSIIDTVPAALVQKQGFIMLLLWNVGRIGVFLSYKSTAIHYVDCLVFPV